MLPALYLTGSADKSLARPPAQYILFDGENISFNANLVICINSTNIPPIMIINKIYETQNLQSLQLVCFLPGRAKDLSAPLYNINPRSILSPEVDRLPQNETCLGFIHLSGNSFQALSQNWEKMHIFVMSVHPCLSVRPSVCPHGKNSSPTSQVFV